MRILLATFTCSLAVLAGASPAGAAIELRGAVPESYDYSVRWSPGSRTLSGTGQIIVENNGPTTLNHVWIRLRPNGDMQLERILTLDSDRFAGSRAGGSMQRVRLEYPLEPGWRTSVGFRFRLRVPRANTSLGRSASADLFGDALPVLAVAGTDGVRIGPEPSYGEGSLNPVAHWRVRVTVPRGLRVVLPGSERVLGHTRWSTRFGSKAQVRDFAFAIGRLRCDQSTRGGVRLSACGASVSGGSLRRSLRRAVRAWTTMQRWYGGYHLPSLKVIVGDLPFGGSEYPGIVFSTPDNATIAHEVAHQWFYGLVGNDQYRDPFLDESLTAYAEQQFHHSYRCNLASPIDGRKHGLGTGMGYWERHPAEYEQTIYRGGACALTVLRRDIGDAAFHTALRAYVQSNVDKIAGVDDFLAAVRAAAPGYDLARWERLVGLR